MILFFICFICFLAFIGVYLDKNPISFVIGWLWILGVLGFIGFMVLFVYAITGSLDFLGYALILPMGVVAAGTWNWLKKKVQQLRQ